MIQKNDLELVDKVIRELGEHYDTVQVFLTRHEAEIEGGTLHVSRGCGNWFARFGQIVTWLKRNDEETCMDVRQQAENE